jgi:hypothetical protein
VTGRGIFFVRRSEGDDTEILFHDFASGRDGVVATVQNFLGPGLSVSPDGERVIFSKIDEYDCNIVVGENLLE